MQIAVIVNLDVLGLSSRKLTNVENKNVVLLNWFVLAHKEGI